MEAAGRDIRVETTGVAEWLRRNPATLAIGATLGAAAAVLLAFTWKLTFYQDTWEFLMNRRSFSESAVLRPHNEHIVVAPVLLEQLFLRVFGMATARPEYVLLIALVLGTAALVFVYVRRRVGPWPALLATAALLFLGPAWEDILWPFQIGFVGSAFFGVAMLLALDREDRRGDIAACAFASLSVAFLDLGLTFVAAGAADVLLKWRRRGLRRAYVAGVPLVLYAAWWAGWGHTAETHLSLHNVLASPPYVVRGFGAATGALLGLSTTNPDNGSHNEWGTAVLLALLVWLAISIWRGRRLPASVLPPAAAGLAFWLLAAFNYFPGREPWASRYVYGGAVFAILIAAELARGVRFRRWWLGLGAVIVAVAIAVNLSILREGRDKLEEQTRLTRADLGALEIARGSVAPSFELSPEIAGTPSLIDVTAGEYLAAAREYGSPAYTPAELARAPQPARRQADIVLSHALSISSRTIVGRRQAPDAPSCIRYAGGGGATGASLPVSSGTTRIVLSPGPPARVGLRRFAVGEYPVTTEAAPGGSVILLTIPADASARPWRLHLQAQQAARVCPAG